MVLRNVGELDRTRTRSSGTREVRRIAPRVADLATLRAEGTSRSVGNGNRGHHPKIAAIEHDFVWSVRGRGMSPNSRSDLMTTTPPLIVTGPVFVKELPVPLKFDKSRNPPPFFVIPVWLTNAAVAVPPAVALLPTVKCVASVTPVIV